MAVRIENLTRARWVFPIVARVGQGKLKRRVETGRLVLGGSHDKVLKGGVERDPKRRPSPVAELSDAQFEELGKTNLDLIAELERDGQLELRRTGPTP
jgi:hypothetical protein